MPITPTYPGVYIEEIPSGVRTITGVATSVAAFIGGAKRGPIDKAVRVLGFADFERRFGGLAKSSEMSYAVRQFFSNGGGEAWIVRVAKSSSAASRTLTREAEANAPDKPKLSVTAKDAGSAGNDIRVFVDHDTNHPASNFNLTVIYAPPGDPSAAITERFENLSMNSGDARYAETVVNQRSQLVTVKRLTTPGWFEGTSTSGALADSDWKTLDSAHDSFRISANGSDPVEVKITPVPPLGPALTNFAGVLQGLIQTAGAAVPALAAMTVSESSGKLVFKSGVPSTEASSVRIYPGLANDASARLRIGTMNGGVEEDGSARHRPDAGPAAGSWTGAEVIEATLTGAPAAGKTTLQISLDGGVARTLTLPAAPPFGTIANLRTRLRDAIRALDTSDAYRKFNVTTKENAGKHAITFHSGTQGNTSSVKVTAGAADDIAATLGLTGGTATAGTNWSLAGGSEVDFDPATPFNSVIGSRALRKGIYALEGVELFNILCIPGVTDAGTLAESAAYCQERRAFFIVDAPRGLTPDQMETAILGTSLPKSNHAAVYYPWLQISDPLNGGALRSVAPSGTIAGVFARTDASRGVWKAPAGTEANLVGVQSADYVLTDRENGVLNPRGVNCNRIMPVYGAIAWGARTLQGDNNFASEWKYVPVRRLALFIEESLYRGTQWVVFEPNDEPLWARIRASVGNFLTTVWRSGALQGTNPDEAFFVKVDRTTMTQDDIDNGRLIILVGVAPVKPAEFVIFRVQQKTLDNQTA